MDWSKYAEHGAYVLIIGTMFFILWRIIIYTMDYISRITDQQNKEREIWMKRMEDLNNSIQLHNQQSMDAHAILKEAGNFQRQEHNKMLDSLNVLANNQKETTITLARINGYKHD